MTSKDVIMKNPQWIGGVVLMLAAATIFIFNVTGDYTPAAITLLIVGIGLAANARHVQGAK